MADFSQLPNELVRMVAERLPPVNLLALSQTCKGLRKTLDVHIEAVLPKTVVAARRAPEVYYGKPRARTSIDKDSKVDHGLGPRGGLSEEESQRLEFLFMLERDGQLSEQRLVCSGCVQTHERYLFSSQTLQKPPTERYCFGWEGRLQVCPHRTMSYVEVTERMVDGWPPFSLCGPCTRERNRWSIMDVCGRWWLQWHRTLTLGASMDLTMPNLTQILKLRCIPFCPHTDSSDKNFLAWIHYHTNPVRFGSNCEDCPAYAQNCRYDSGYVGHYSCNTCGMRVTMSTANQGLGCLEGIQITVLRDLGPRSTKPTNPQWIASLTFPSLHNLEF